MRGVTTVNLSETLRWHPTFIKLLNSERATVISALFFLLCSSLQSSGGASGAKFCCIAKDSPLAKDYLPFLDLHRACIGIRRISLTLPKGMPLPCPFYKRLSLHHWLHEYSLILILPGTCSMQQELIALYIGAINIIFVPFHYFGVHMESWRGIQSVMVFFFVSYKKTPLVIHCNLLQL